MNHSRSRKKWGNGNQELQVPLNVPAVKEEVPPQYQHYLHLLQERNRLVQRLRKKSKKEIETEKKEKGFTLYLNTVSDHSSSDKKRPQRAKTAGAADQMKRSSDRSDQRGQLVSQSGGAGSRAREKRRNWQIGSVEFTTADGQRQRVRPPEILSGKYAEDFDDVSSDDEDDDDDDDDSAEVVHSMSSLALDDSVSSSTSSLNTPRRHKTSYLKRVAAAKREEIELENRVAIKMEDVKKLRESLQMNKFIRQSLALDADSDIEEDICEELAQESDGERISPIGEEIEELIYGADENDNQGTDMKPLKLFSPGDTLVLEFQPLQPKVKSGANLTAARKKTPDTSTGHQGKPTSAPASSNKSAVPRVPDMRSSQSKPGSSKSARPLSANRRSSDCKADTREEASAVMRALAEENKKAELFSKVSRPLPRPKSPSVGDKSSSSSADKAKPPTPVRSSADPEPTRASGGMTSQVKADGSPINNVIQKVLKMNPKQQKQLLQTLNHIEVADSGLQNDVTAPPLCSMASSWSSKAPVTDRLEVTVEISSNWGHPSLVGLTELQFFDQSGLLVPIKPSDVSVHGARGETSKVEVLFNGKSKTTKERNMWSCKFDGRPIEFSILLINPLPGKPFNLGAVKVWNWNNKISNLDIGAKCMRIFFGGELLFSGDVDKGCGNQVFDYSKHVVFSSSLRNSNSVSSSGIKSKPPGLSLNLNKRTSTGGSYSPTSNNSVVDQTGPGPAVARMTSPSKGLVSPSRGNKNSNPNTPSSGSHHVFRSISRSSQSSASSSGSVNSGKVRGQSEERNRHKHSVDGQVGEGHVRSETRTLMRPTVLTHQGSGGSSPDVEVSAADLSKMPEKKKAAQTPIKTKRVAARLNGRSSETENSSKSNADSFESKPPLPPCHKSDDKPVLSSASRSVERSSSSSTRPKLSPKSSKSEPHISPRGSSSPHRSAANTSSTGGDSRPADPQEKNSIVDKIKTMGQSENKKKKDIPRWLKKDGATGEDGEARGDKTGLNNPDETDLQKQLDEEFERFSSAGTEDQNKGDGAPGEEEDTITPMKKIEKSRAKWRRKEEDLEESWGSLSFFNKSQRGRLSIDMGDDELDEYLAPSKKPSVEAEPAPKLTLPEDNWSDEDGEFTIPELPSGRELVINIKTTWGDHHYVGLTGVQLFSSQGEQVQVTKIWANPSDINILPEYAKDPRVVGNLIDNVNRTRDDVHMWLAPFTVGNNHLIYMTFAKPCQLAMVRVWNYNKSRIHSFRGAKDIIITLDGTEIFKGEIARACGGIEGGTEAFGDTILFTTDETILEAVSKNDDAFEGEMLSDGEEDVPFERPSTADADDDDQEDKKTRPFTRAAGLLAAAEKGKEKQPLSARPGTSMVTSVGDVVVYKANKIELSFSATWGDHHYLGLTGLEPVGTEGEAIPLTMKMITASPSDLRHLAGNEKDERTLDKLIDGSNVTCHDSHMWLIPFAEGESHTVTLTFPQQMLVSGVRVWNYNKSPEDTYRGAKVMHVQVNDRVVSPPEGYLLRKGPGVCHFDFAQEITFANSSVPSQPSTVDRPMGGGELNYESVVQMPRGFIFQFQLFSTWGDQYYVGLNGLEFYDVNFSKIELTQTNISAYPDSVNVLDNVSNDARTPDKLIDGLNDTADGRHMWLAPVLPNIINRVYVIFDQPTSVSMIKMWNYSKTVSRGVKDFALLVDDLLVYNGTLQGVTSGARGILPNCEGPVPHHTVLFSDNKDIVRKERNAIISNQTEDQDIQLLNDKQVVSKFAKSSSSKPVNQALRPKTSVTKTARR
ncbi:katanin-interacting protein isoform X2 [Aplysia californica]|uniref:Katanin-interacting protein isoform X2 n=1 Tax=Aplysia californica TaxID=6500 RepID=A0ABM0JT53_APLCA|nr:katanin-interacting protein isoform X2 [Aplysia californica]